MLLVKGSDGRYTFQKEFGKIEREGGGAPSDLPQEAPPRYAPPSRASAASWRGGPGDRLSLASTATPSFVGYGGIAVSGSGESWKPGTRIGIESLDIGRADSMARRTLVSTAEADTFRDRGADLCGDLQDPRRVREISQVPTPLRGDSTLTNELVASTEKVRGRLLAMGTTFHDLDKQVEEDVRRRRELEQQSFRELVQFLSKLESALAVEAERRDAAEREVEHAVDMMLEKMVSHIHGKLSERFSNLNRSVEALTERCSNLERGIQQFEGTLPTKLTVDAESLKHVLQNFHRDFVEDTKQTIERDERLGRRIQEVVEAVENGCSQEHAQLERQVETLQSTLFEFTAAEESGQTKGRNAAVLGHISALKDGLAEEVRSREEVDDRVVQAINEYAAQFHHTLRLTNA